MLGGGGHHSRGTKTGTTDKGASSHGTGSKSGSAQRSGAQPTGVKDSTAKAAGQGNAVGQGFGAIDKATGPLKSKDPGSRIGSENAAHGTFARDRAALDAGYGGDTETTGWLGRVLGFKTYRNPISRKFSGVSVDPVGLAGTIAGAAMGAPLVGTIVDALSPAEVGFGPAFAAWRGQKTGPSHASAGAAANAGGSGAAAFAAAQRQRMARALAMRRAQSLGDIVAGV